MAEKSLEADHTTDSENDFIDIGEATEYKAKEQTPEFKQRRLLLAISKTLNQIDLKAIAQYVNIQLSTMQTNKLCAIELLFELEEKRVFTVDNTEPLKEILLAINRSDIVEKILTPLGSPLSQPKAIPSQSQSTHCQVSFQATLESQETHLSDRQELVTSYGSHKSWWLIRTSNTSSAVNLGIANEEQEDDKFTDSNACKDNVSDSTAASGNKVLSKTDKLITHGHSPTIENLIAKSSNVGSDGSSSDSESSQNGNNSNSTLTESTESPAHEWPESLESSCSTNISSRPHTLDRLEMGKNILRHLANKCISHQRWCIELSKYVIFKVKNEFYPYGLGEDASNHTTLKMIVTPKIIESSSFFLSKHSLTFYATVVTDSRPLEQLVVTGKKTVEIHAGHNVELHFRLLEHNEHILKLKNKSFKVSVHAEVNVHQINLTSEDVEDNFAKIDATI